MAKKTTAPAAAGTPNAWGGTVETVDDLPPVAARPQGRDTIPLGEVSEPYFWVASPHSWQVLAGRVVPSLRKISLHRGGGRNLVNSVKGADKKVRADPTFAIATANAKGEIVLDYYDPRTYVTMPDGTRKPYLTRVKSTGGYISRFQTLYPGTAETSTDTDAYAAWLEQLIADGVLPPPPIHQLRRLQTVISGQINAYRDRAGLKAAYGSRTKMLENDLAAVNAALEAHRKRTLATAEPAETDDELPPPVPATAGV